MPDEIPRYCVKCGRNFFARYDVIDAQILLWCPAPTCRDVQKTLPIFGFHHWPASQQEQVQQMIERTETATNETQGSEFLRVFTSLVEMNDPIRTPLPGLTFTSVASVEPRRNENPMVAEKLPGVKQEPRQLTKTERYERWLGFWKLAAALPCPERILKSARRPHQKRGPIEKSKPTGPRPRKPEVVLKKLAKHRRYHEKPVWPGYTAPREVA